MNLNIQYALAHSFELQQYLRGNIENIYTELALYGSKDESARTDNVSIPISEVCNGMVSLKKSSSFEYLDRGGPANY